MKSFHTTLAITARTTALILFVGLLLAPYSVVFGQSRVTSGDSENVTVKATPPRQGLQNEAVTVGIDYTVKAHLGEGKALVTYHNVDTGQEFTKTLDILLTKGKHRVEAIWEPTETLPSGMYVIKVVLVDEEGQKLASYETNPDAVKTLILVGGATRILNPDEVAKDLEDLTTWREELEVLETAAKEAGADTTREHLLIVVLEEMEFWSKERVQLKQYEIMDRNHEYLEQAVAETKERLIAMAADPTAFPTYPKDLRTKERYTIRDGYWHAGDQPVFLNGPCFFNYTLGYLPVASKLGFNVIQISTGPSSIFPTSGDATGTPRAIDYNEKTKTGELVKVLDQCAELGLKVDLGLTSHFMPKWVYEKWPDAKNQFCLYNMMPYDIEHPEMLKLVEGFYKEVMPQIAGHPALNSIWIANEPEYMNPNERNMEIFRPWLQEKYGSVAKLNEAWGTELTSFDDIVASGRKGHPVPDAVSTDAAMMDWWTYSTERLMHHYEWQKSLIRQYEPDLPIAVKLYNGTFNPQFKPMSRADEESSWDRMDYMGISGGSYPFSKPYKDFARSLDPSKPLANLEYKFGGQRAKMDFWQEAMQGASHINWWCWHTKPAFSPVPAYARAMHYAALDTLDVQRLLPQVMAFNELPRTPMVFLYPDPVKPRYFEYFGVSHPTNRVVTTMGYNVDYASEDRIAEGRLDDYELIVMPAADFIRDETYARVTKFVEDGGTALIIGAVPGHDEMSKPRDASFFDAPANAEELSINGYKAVKFPAGNGMIYHLPEVPRSDDGKRHLTDESSDVIEAFLELVTKAELPPQPVIIRDYENRTIEYTNDAGKKTYLTYLVNESFDEPATIEPKFNVEVTACRDLISGKTFDPQKIVVPPTDVMMLEFTVAE